MRPRRALLLRCGDADLAAQTSTFSAGISGRTCITANVDAPCPRCVDGFCDRGPNVGLACHPVGSAGTTIDCPPEPEFFAGALSVVLQEASTEPHQLDAPSDGLFCPEQSTSGAFGRPDVQRIVTRGSRLNPVGLLSNDAIATVAGPFCVPSTGVSILDAAGGFAAPGAVSVPIRIDLTNLLALGLPPLLP